MGAGEWVDGGVGAPYTHAHVCMYDIIGNSQGFLQWGLPCAIEMFNMYICVCRHMHVHVCGAFMVKSMLNSDFSLLWSDLKES